jgi:hypothetical protein
LRAWSYGLPAEERADLTASMIWLRYAIAVAVILITGRIHSKRLESKTSLTWRRD